MFVPNFKTNCSSPLSSECLGYNLHYFSTIIVKLYLTLYIKFGNKCFFVRTKIDLLIHPKLQISTIVKNKRYNIKLLPLPKHIYDIRILVRTLRTK